MTDALATATERAAQLHREANAIGAELASEWRPAARMAIYARSAMLRQEARELVAFAEAERLYGPAQTQRRKLDHAMAQLT